MVMSRTDGAPTLPILSEEEAALRELQRQSLGMGGEPPLSPQEYAARRAALMARTLGVPESADRTGMSVAQMYQQARAEFEQDGDQDKFSRAIDAIFESQRRPPPSSTDGMPGPMTGTEEDYQAYMGMTQDPLEPMRQEGRDMQNARDYGRRVGGGAPFTSEGDAQQYNQRTHLSEEQKAAMLAAGATEGEIIDAQRSQYDRDMGQVGITGGTGWVPVYGPSGTVTYMERAPVPGDGMGATDKAVGGARRVGPSVDNREVKPGLDRPDLEARGYESTPIDGPYGKEWVYKATKISADMRARMKADYGFTDAEIDELEAGGDRGTTPYQLATRAIKDRRQKENMVARAGVSPEQGAGMNRMQLRQLIRENREAELAQRKEAARLARMNPRVRREVALEQLNDPNAEDWQRGAIADILGFEGPTPLGVDQRALEGAWRLAQAALQNESTNPLQDAQADMATRAQAPALAGMRDLEAGDFQSAEAQTFVNNLAERFDTQAGGFSLQDEQRLAEHLQQRYNMPQDEAERMAYVAGNNRRWLKSSGPAPANPAGQSLPRSPSAQPPRESGQRVPPRQGGRRGGAPSQPFQFPESGGGRGRGGSRPGVPPR